MSYADLFKQARNDCNASLRQFAKLLHIDPAHLCRIEQGVKTPSEKLMARLLVQSPSSVSAIVQRRKSA